MEKIRMPKKGDILKDVSINPHPPINGAIVEKVEGGIVYYFNKKMDKRSWFNLCYVKTGDVKVVGIQSLKDLIEE